MENRTTPENIVKLKENEIFVFGSNLSGRHGKGAAKQALTWGARWGQARGLHPKDVAPLFSDAVYIDNIHLPSRFWHKIK